MDLLARTGVGRDINRSYFHRADVEAALCKPVVRGLIDLIRFRNRHPAFEGEFQLESGGDSAIALQWTNRREWARLDVDLARLAATVTYTTSGGVASFAVEPHDSEGPQE
jgi:sucrose phosphorylase